MIFHEIYFVLLLLNLSIRAGNVNFLVDYSDTESE